MYLLCLCVYMCVSVYTHAYCVSVCVCISVCMLACMHMCVSPCMRDTKPFYIATYFTCSKACGYYKNSISVCYIRIFDISS